MSFTKIINDNLLINQIDYTKIIDKYNNIKLKTVPNELLKYYEYLTTEQPFLDELNYISKKMKDADYEKLKQNYENIEKIAKEREAQLKKSLHNDIFDNSPEMKAKQEQEKIRKQEEEMKAKQEEAKSKISDAIKNRKARQEFKRAQQEREEEMFSNADTEFKFKPKKSADDYELERILKAIKDVEGRIPNLKQKAAIDRNKEILEKLYYRLEKHREKMNNK